MYDQVNHVTTMWPNGSCDWQVCTDEIRDTQDARPLNTHWHPRQPCMNSVCAMHANTPLISTTQLNRRQGKANEMPTKVFYSFVRTHNIHTTRLCSHTTHHTIAPHTYVHLHVPYKSAHAFVLPIREVNKQAIVRHFVHTQDMAFVFQLHCLVMAGVNTTCILTVSPHQGYLLWKNRS